jgi:hypothetical protein
MAERTNEPHTLLKEKVKARNNSPKLLKHLSFQPPPKISYMKAERKNNTTVQVMHIQMSIHKYEKLL